jgi:hypothetical protein
VGRGPFTAEKLTSGPDCLIHLFDSHRLIPPEGYLQPHESYQTKGTSRKHVRRQYAEDLIFVERAELARVSIIEHPNVGRQS